MALFTRLILLDPGTIQTHPDMGVGLVSRYCYTLEGSEMDLQADIRRQIDTYLPDFRGAEVIVRMVEHSYRIGITFQNYIFAFLYDTEENTLVNKYTRLADL